MGSHRVGHDLSNLAAAAAAAMTNGTSQVALMIKNLPANAGDIRDVSLIPGSGRPLEEGMATHCSILAWGIPWTEEPGGLLHSQRVDND